MIINRVAIMRQDTGDWLHLDPRGPRGDGLKIAATGYGKVIIEDIPRGDPIIAYSRQSGYRLAISGWYHEVNAGAGLLRQDIMRGHLRDANGDARTVDLCAWVDGSGAIKRIYRDCKLVSEDITFGDSSTEARRPYSLELFCPHFTRYSTASNGTTPAAGPYEAFLYNGEAGTPTGVGSGTYLPTGVLVIPVTFYGTITGATDASNADYWQREFVLNSNSAFEITGIEIAGCAGKHGTSGTFTVAVSDTPYSTSMNEITASIAYSTTKSALSTGSITIAAGNQAYVYIKSAAYHDFPTVHIHARSV